MQTGTIKRDASALLCLLGITDIDGDLLGLCLRSVTERICNATNQREIPAGLRMAAVYRTAGEYLRLKQSGLSEADMENAVAAAVAEIREGDIAVKFQADHTAEQKFAALVEALATAGEADFARWRRIVW